jgi:hypothetical protein
MVSSTAVSVLRRTRRMMLMEDVVGRRVVCGSAKEEERELRQQEERVKDSSGVATSWKAPSATGACPQLSPLGVWEYLLVSHSRQLAGCATVELRCKYNAVQQDLGVMLLVRRCHCKMHSSYVPRARFPPITSPHGGSSPGHSQSTGPVLRASPNFTDVASTSTAKPALPAVAVFLA